MAVRRQLASLADLLLRSHLQNKQMERQSALVGERQRELADLNNDNEALRQALADPSGRIAESLTQMGKAKYAPLVPTGDEAVSGQGAGLNAISDLQKLPTDVGQEEALRSAPGGAEASKDPRNIEYLMAQRKAREAAIKAGTAPVRQTSVNDAGTAMQESYVNPWDAPTRQTTFTGQQQGAQDAAKTIAADSPEAIAAESRKAGSLRTATNVADFPYSTSELLEGDDKNLHAFRSGPKGMVEIPLPPGYQKPHAGGSERPLAAAQVDQIAGLNMAEVEGVKVLQSLRKTGLEHSNDPLDPRWHQFMVQTLKIAPADWDKADIQQRTAAVTALLTRGMMGARQSQYVAELLMKHLPQGSMTGQQLAHVLNNVMQQSGERRVEIEGLTGREPGSLKPKSGMSYEDWYGSQPASPANDIEQSVQEKLKKLGGGGPQ